MTYSCFEISPTPNPQCKQPQKHLPRKNSNFTQYTKTQRATPRNPLRLGVVSHIQPHWSVTEKKQGCISLLVISRGQMEWFKNMYLPPLNKFNFSIIWMWTCCTDEPEKMVNFHSHNINDHWKRNSILSPRRGPHRWYFTKLDYHNLPGCVQLGVQQEFHCCSSNGHVCYWWGHFSRSVSSSPWMVTLDGHLKPV